MNLLKLTSVAALLIGLGFLGRTARAQEWTKQSFLLPKGGFEVTGEPARPTLMRINISKDSAFKPVEFPPEFFWGITDDVMLGITHVHGLRLNTGANDHKLRNTYNDVGFGSVIRLAQRDNYEIALHAGLPLHQLSPDLFVGLQAGILGRVDIARHTSLYFDPYLYLAVTHRDQGNESGLGLPFWFYFQVTDTIVPFVGGGLNGPFNHFGDRFAIPLEGGCLFTVADGITIGGDLEFSNAFGRNATLDYGRSLGFLGQFRF